MMLCVTAGVAYKSRSVAGPRKAVAQAAVRRVMMGKAPMQWGMARAVAPVPEDLVLEMPRVPTPLAVCKARLVPWLVGAPAAQQSLEPMAHSVATEWTQARAKRLSVLVLEAQVARDGLGPHTRLRQEARRQAVGRVMLLAAAVAAAAVLEVQVAGLLKRRNGHLGRARRMMSSSKASLTSGTSGTRLRGDFRAAQITPFAIDGAACSR